MTDFKSNIWKFYLLNFFVSFEIVAGIFVLFLLANHLTLVQVMFLETLFVVSLFVMEVPSGVFADLYGLKTTFGLASLLLALGWAGYGLSHSFFTFFLSNFSLAAGYALWSGADSAFVYDTLKEIKHVDKFKKIMGRTRTFAMLAIGVSSVIGGFLAELLGFRPLYFIGATFIFLGFFIVLSLKEPKPYQKIVDKNFLVHLKQGLNIVRQNSKIKKYMIYFSFLGAFGLILFPLFQPYLQQGDIPVRFIGLSVGAYFLFMGLGYIVAEPISKLFKKEKLLLLLILLITVLVFLGISWLNVLIGLFLILLLSFMKSIADLVIGHTINDSIDSEHRATVISIKNMGQRFVYAIIAPFVGYFIDIFSLKEAFLMMGILLGVFWIYNLFLFRK